MNEIKTFGLQAEVLIEKLKAHIRAQLQKAGEFPADIDKAEPERWCAMGRTDMQTALMKLTRSVAQPPFF